jgi:enoyl-[acyl-carrier protein] reductase II
LFNRENLHLCFINNFEKVKNRIIELFNIKYPIIQAGMVWCSGWELASAVSNAGGLGLIGAGSMHPEILKIHIKKTKQATNLPFGVNIPLLYPEIDKIIEIIINEKVEIVFTSAGNPNIWTETLKKAQVKVVHVVANTKFAQKAEDAGVDAIVAEGFEAGGHNGREETTTLTLIPMIKAITKLPVIAAGGIATGRGMLAAMALGADGVQVGSRFVASVESSAHENFKNEVIKTGEGGTRLSMKKLVPVRLIKNKFSDELDKAESEGKSTEFIKELLGHRRAKIGMFEGDLTEGELEIGQVASMIKEIKTAKEIVDEIINEYQLAKIELSKQDFDF